MYIVYHNHFVIESRYGINFNVEFCAGDSDVTACHGDSGGPLICFDGNQPVLYGIASWGDECDTPAFYVKVANYIKWISEIIDL